MERLTLLVSSSGRYLSPAEAVLLYRQLYLLNNFLEYGTVVANQIRVGYAEEFRYDSAVDYEQSVLFDVVRGASQKKNLFVPFFPKLLLQL